MNQDLEIPGNYIIVDDYFPPWLIDKISYYFKTFPVTYTNTPQKHSFDRSRFMGNMIMIDNDWMVPGVDRSWFLDYLNNSLMHDILGKYNIRNCARCLVNGQFALERMNGINHTDSDDVNYVSVIYMAHGKSGDTVICDDNDNDVKKISFKEGRMVAFNSLTRHRGEAPTSGYRVSLGLVYPLFTPVVMNENNQITPR